VRLIAVLATLFGVFSVFIYEARADGTWCARYPEAASNCGFYSFTQCDGVRQGWLLRAKRIFRTAADKAITKKPSPLGLA
jgi:hypothetical protein